MALTRRLKRIAALFTLATSVVTAAACRDSLNLPEGAQPAPATQNDNTAPRLFASAETIQSLDWIAGQIPGWANSDVLLINKEDLNIPAGWNETVLKSLGASSSSTAANVDSSLTRQMLAARTQSFAMRFSPLRESLNDLSTPHPNTQLRINLGTHAFTRDPISIKTSYSSVTGSRDLCIITLPPADMDAKGYFNFLTNIPADLQTAIPGGRLEWLSLIMAHEAGHCRNAEAGAPLDPNDTITREIIADQYAVDIFNRLLLEGRVTNSDIPKAALDARAITAILGASTTHATNIGVNRPMTAQTRTPSAHSLNSTLQGLYIKILSEAGLSAWPTKDTAPHPDVPHALRLLGRHPWLLLKTVKDLEARNAFSNDPVQETYARQFIRAAETRAPAYFRAPGLTPSS